VVVDSATKFGMRHAATLRGWKRDDYEALFEHAGWMAEQTRADLTRIAPGMLLGTLFYQNSTRTRLSFEAAAHRIGGSAVGFSDVSTTRAGDFYQESLDDTVRVIGRYADILVLRHTNDDAAERAASISPVPVISAGTGDREHPTQALLDLWVLRDKLDKLDGAVIGYAVIPRAARPAPWSTG
jgi:aspartate carbamoyltransferase catalytic subunit